MEKKRAYRTLARLVAFVLMTSTGAVALTSGPADAAPGCRNGGFLTVYARGATAELGNEIAAEFFENADAKIDANGGGNEKFELGSEGGYAAHDFGPQYSFSVEEGANTLVTLLNNRNALKKPQ